MKLRPIPRHWQKKISEDPNGDFAKRVAPITAKIAGYNHVQTKIDSVSGKSNVGSILKQYFEKRIGALPCSKCKNTIIALNKRSIDNILADKDKIVEKIFQNSKIASKPFWAKLLLFADDKLNDGNATKFMIERWLLEACEHDRSNSITTD